MDYDALLNLGTELGYNWYSAVRRSYRVGGVCPSTVDGVRLQPQVFALPSCLIVSVNTPAGHPITQMRRVPPHGTDIELLERCNDLCRQLCREVPPLPEAAKLVGKLGQDHRSYPTRVLLLGYAAAAAFLPRFTAGRCWIPCAAACAAWRWESGCCGPARAYALTTCFRP